MNAFAIFKYADSSAAEMSRIVYQCFHHDPVSFQEILHVKWIQ